MPPLRLRVSCVALALFHEDMNC